LIDNINNSQHSITGYTPNDIQKAYKNNDKIVLDSAYDKELKKKKSNISREVFEKGDLVRLYRPSDKTRQSWSVEVYEIIRVYKPESHIVYMSIKWKDSQTDFKEEELLKVVGEPQNKIMKVEKFVISKLIKPVIQNNKVYYEVQWKDHKDTPLEPRQTLLKDIPKMLNQFEKKNDIIFYDSRNTKTDEITRRYYYGVD